jgi:membrane protein
VAFFALTALLLINSIEYALNEVWQVFESRSIAQRMTIFCAILVVGPILILSTYYTTKLRLEPFLSGLEILQDVSISINHILSVLLDSLALFALYYLVPKAPVRITPAIFGSLIAAVLFETAKFFFTSYIVQFTSYDKIYGALSIIPIFLFWLYITWSIVLFGAQCSFQFQHLPRNGKMWKKQITSVGDATIVLAIQVLVIISKAFKNGDKPLNEFEIADKLGTSSIVINPIIENLKKCQIVARSDSREMPLMLLVNPEKISLFDILEKNEFRLYDSDSLSKVGAFLQNLSQNSSSEPSKDAVLSKNIKEIHLSDLI